MRPSSQSLTYTPAVMCIDDTSTRPSLAPLLFTIAATSSVMRMNSWRFFVLNHRYSVCVSMKRSRASRLFQRSVVGRHHEDVVDLHVHLHLGPRLHPLGISAERGPGGIASRAVLVREQVHQLVGFGDRLPETDDGHAVFAKERVRVIAEA